MNPDEAPARGPGRPPGSLKITSEGRQLLLAAVEAGGSDHAAARAAHIDPRTFRTYRRIAEGRHPTRTPTPDLLELFREIDEAAARSRIRREIAVAEKDPKHWLRYQAPSEPGLPGWTERVPEDQEEQIVPVYSPTPEEFAETLRALAEATGVSLGHCGDPSCTCSLHEEEHRDEA
jgi:hypothetical protein